MSMDQVVRDKNDPIEEEEDEVTPPTFLSLLIWMLILPTYSAKN